MAEGIWLKNPEENRQVCALGSVGRRLPILTY